MQVKPVKKERRPVILAIYGCITLSLIAASFLVPRSQVRFPEVSLPESISLTLPAIGKIVQLPHTLLYVAAGTIMLFVFDSVLKKFFHRAKNS